MDWTVDSEKDRNARKKEDLVNLRTMAVASIHEHISKQMFPDPQDAQPGKIGPNGMARLLGELKLAEDDRQVLILAQRMNAEVIDAKFGSRKKFEGKWALLLLGTEMW